MSRLISTFAFSLSLSILMKKKRKQTNRLLKLILPPEMQIEIKSKHHFLNIVRVNLETHTVFCVCFIFNSSAKPIAFKIHVRLSRVYGVCMQMNGVNNRTNNSFVMQKVLSIK